MSWSSSWPASASTLAASVRVNARSRGPISATRRCTRIRAIGSGSCRRDATASVADAGNRSATAASASARRGCRARAHRRARRRTPYAPRRRRRHRRRGPPTRAAAPLPGHAHRPSPTRTGGGRGPPIRAAASSSHSRPARRARRAEARRGPRAAAPARVAGPRCPAAAGERSTSAWSVGEPLRRPRWSWGEHLDAGGRAARAHACTSGIGQHTHGDRGFRPSPTCDDARRGGRAYRHHGPDP